MLILLRTWIFTFDSLGSKHPAATNNLALYLQLEAQDKKGLDPANTTPPGKKTALVIIGVESTSSSKCGPSWFLVELLRNGVVYDCNKSRENHKVVIIFIRTNQFFSGRIQS